MLNCLGIRNLVTPLGCGVAYSVLSHVFHQSACPLISQPILYMLPSRRISFTHRSAILRPFLSRTTSAHQIVGLLPIDVIDLLVVVVAPSHVPIPTKSYGSLNRH